MGAAKAVRQRAKRAANLMMSLSLQLYRRIKVANICCNYIQICEYLYMSTKQNAVIKDSRTGKILMILTAATHTQVAAALTCMRKHFGLTVEVVFN